MQQNRKSLKRDDVRGWNVISLFGGIETGYAALIDAGIPIENYWGSEIDKNPIKVVRVKYPQVGNLGDVCGVNVSDLPFVPDLLLAGFPCTDLSFAGKMAGLDGTRSGLFFEAVRILRECQAVNPNVLFLFENVPMAKRHEFVINETLGIQPWKSCASLVSAQTRKRLWWSNIRTKKVGLFGDLVTDFPQPKDQGILLADILQAEVDEKYYLKGKTLDRLLSENPKTNPEKSYSVTPNSCTNSGGRSRQGTFVGVVNNNGTLQPVEKSNCIDANFHKGIDNHGQSPLAVVVKKDGTPKPNQDKAACFTAGGNSGGNHSDMDLIWQTARGKNPGGDRTQNGKTPCVSANWWERNNHVFCLNPKRTEYGKAVRKDYEAGKIKGAKRSDMATPQPRDDGKSGTITTVEKDNILQVGKSLRRLTPVEVCRLFTLPDNLFQDENGKNIIAESNQYKALGNCWVMKVVSHIFSFLPELK